MLDREEQVKRAQWLIGESSRKKFFGRILVVMEGGNIVHIERYQGLKVEEIKINDKDLWAE